jgi:hypothetical protein
MHLAEKVGAGKGALVVCVDCVNILCKTYVYLNDHLKTSELDITAAPQDSI